MNSVSQCIGLAFTINPYILQYVLRQITPFRHTLGKFAAKARILSAESEFGKIGKWPLKFSYRVW